MRRLFDRPGLEDLAAFARTNVFLAFDFDGTLAPITAHPDQAKLRPGTKQLLTELSRAYPCAVISGRAKLDALDRIGHIQRWAATGNHGADVMGGTAPYEEQVRAWGPVIRAGLADIPGVLIEDKRFSVSIHYRNAVERREAVAAIDRTVRTLPGARVLGGKMVVNVVPADAPHKGTALDCMRRWAGCDTAIYVGDDVTDEDAFALPESEVLSIRVGPGASRARYFVESQSEVDRLLGMLIELREQAVRLQAHL